MENEEVKKACSTSGWKALKQRLQKENWVQEEVEKM